METGVRLWYKQMMAGCLMHDRRSGRIVIASHCLLNVHSLEDDLALYPGLEEELIEMLIKKGVGIYQIPCPEVELAGIFRKPLPKESYDHPKIKKVYAGLAESISQTLIWYVRKGYQIPVVLGAEGSPTCGIERVGKWKKNVQGRRQFPRDIEFVPGTGVFMEEFKNSLSRIGVNPVWIGIPGKSLRSIRPESFDEILCHLDNTL